MLREETKLNLSNAHLTLQVDEELLDAAGPQLRVVSTMSVGYGQSCQILAFLLASG